MQQPPFGYSPDVLSDFGQRWLGYGRLDAPHWFIGLAPGGDDLDACVKAWLHYNKGLLLDVQEGHRFHGIDFFSSKSRTPQPTWQKLIWFMLAYRGEDQTADATLRFRRTEFARSDATLSDNTLAELSAFPTPDDRAPDSLRPEFLKDRISKMHDIIAAFEPEYVVMYGLGDDNDYLPYWNEVAGFELRPHVPKRINRTVFSALYHPNYAWSKDYWTLMARRVCEQVRDAKP